MSEPGKNLPVPQAPAAKAEDAKAANAKAKRAARRAKAKASKAEKAKTKQEKAARGPVGVARLFGWFVVGIAAAAAAAIAVLLWSAWSEPAYVVSPRLSVLASDFGGYALGALVFCLALVAAMLFRGAVAWVGFSLLTVVAALVVGGQALMLSMGITSCERERMLEAASPDRRLVVIALKGACGGSEESYRVKVRELGPLVPREVTIFESFAKPVPAEIAFAEGGAITIVAKPDDDGTPGTRYPVTIDRRSMKPDKVWKLSEGRAAGGS